MALYFDKEQFYKMEELKQSKKGAVNLLYLLMMSFIKNAKKWLQNSKKNHEECGLSKMEVNSPVIL